MTMTRPRTSRARSSLPTGSSGRGLLVADRVGAGGQGEIRRGAILHRYTAPSKGIQMLRLERELEGMLERWRAAVKRDPEAWR
jgi:hypothetical protein